MKKFDLAFSMGFSCGGTLALRKAGLQFASYPLDWIGSPGIVQSARMIACGFENWFEKDDLELVAVRGGSFQNDIYQNIRTRFGFPHDFSRFSRFEDSYPKVAEKYVRRVNRFLERLSSVTSALVIYVERPINRPAPDANLVLARDILSAAFPEVRFELVYFHVRAGAPAERTVADGITAVACDYMQMDHGEVSHAIHWELLCRYLLDRVEVKNRSKVEQEDAYVGSKRNLRRKMFGSRLNEIEYRIFRHLEKDLQERGLVPRDFPLWFD